MVSQLSFLKSPQNMNAEDRELSKKWASEPWRRVSSIQIFRIFENLLYLYDGLANVYRRGTDKERLVNVFSNLETKQLLDKQFEIPRIGNFQMAEDAEQPQRSRASGSRDNLSESSFNSYKSRVNKMGSLRSQRNSQPKGLTKEALHPEMQLFRRKQTPKCLHPTEHWLIETIRLQHGQKELRETKLMKETTKQDSSIN